VFSHDPGRAYVRRFCAWYFHEEVCTFWKSTPGCPSNAWKRKFCLQVLLGVKQALMQLHNGCLLISAAPVSLHHLLPHLPNLQSHAMTRCDRLTVAQTQMTQEENNAVQRQHHCNTESRANGIWCIGRWEVTGLPLKTSSALVIAAKCCSVTSVVAKNTPLLITMSETHCDKTHCMVVADLWQPNMQATLSLLITHLQSFQASQRNISLLPDSLRLWLQRLHLLQGVLWCIAADSVLGQGALQGLLTSLQAVVGLPTCSSIWLCTSRQTSWCWLPGATEQAKSFFVLLLNTTVQSTIEKYVVKRKTTKWAKNH